MQGSLSLSARRTLDSLSSRQTQRLSSFRQRPTALTKAAPRLALSHRNSRAAADVQLSRQPVGSIKLHPSSITSSLPSLQHSSFLFFLSFDLFFSLGDAACCSDACLVLTEHCLFFSLSSLHYICNFDLLREKNTKGKKKKRRILRRWRHQLQRRRGRKSGQRSSCLS